MKKKLTFSISIAFALCLCIIATAARSASSLLSSVRPDATQPLSCSENTVAPSLNLNGMEDCIVYMEKTPSPVFHIDRECAVSQTDESLIPMTLSEAFLQNVSPCAVCCDFPCYMDIDNPALYHLFSECPLNQASIESTFSQLVQDGRMLCEECISLLSDYQNEFAPSVSYSVLTEYTIPLISTTEDIARTPYPTATCTPVPTAEDIACTPYPTATCTPVPTAEDTIFVWSKAGARYYHVNSVCGGLEGAECISLADAELRMQSACPQCRTASPTPVPTECFLAPSSDRLSPTPAPVLADSPSESVEKENPSDASNETNLAYTGNHLHLEQPNWVNLDPSLLDSCQKIILHSADVLSMPGCLYAEFEFTLTDPSADPYSIQIIPVNQDGDDLIVLTQSVFSTSDANDVSTYLLCEVMYAPSDSFSIDSLHVCEYQSSSPEP